MNGPRRLRSRKQATVSLLDKVLPLQPQTPKSECFVDLKPTLLMAAQVAPSAYGMSRSKFYLRSMLARTPSRSEYSTACMEQPAAALR